MASFVSTRTGQFAYFNRQLGDPEWAGKRVLDFGGNAGNILLDPECLIEPDNYWSIDVSRDSMVVGKRRHPHGHFIFYDRYNFEFNPTGTGGLPIPDPGVRFDYILAWSVITHISKAEVIEFASRLMEFLTDDGRAAFSFIDPWWTPPPGWARDTEYPELPNLQWRLEARRATSPGLDVDGLLRRAREARHSWTTLVNEDEMFFDPDNDGLAMEKPPRYYITFATPQYLQQLFPDAKILDPVPPERLHCLVMDKDAGRPAF
jgi:hypothetical protein